MKFFLRCLVVSVLFTFVSVINFQESAHADTSRHRVIVSTDIGGTDPDDFQSMVHLLLYSDTLEIEGLISSPFGPGRKQHILEVVDQYALDYPNLKTWSDSYPTPEELRKITKQGETEVAPYAGYRTPTEGSNWIIQRARVQDSRPLHLLIWGGIEDLAQALHDAPDILPKLRVFYIGGPNKKWGPNAYQYIATHFPELWIIESNASYRGWFVGGDQTGLWSNKSFVSNYIEGKGHLGNYFATQLEGVIKMGDSPSVTWLLHGNPAQPEQATWSGEYVRAWPRPHKKFGRLTTASDQIEEYSILELVLPANDDAKGSNKKAAYADLYIENLKLQGYFDQQGQVHFRYSPKAANQFSYYIKSNIASLNKKQGAITAVTVSSTSAQKPDTSRPHWWTDNPAMDYREGEYIGAKSVNRWRKAFLGDFAKRIQRAAMPAVEKWDFFEVTLDGPKSGNPFIDVQLSATFSHKEKQISVEGFYDGKGRYKIRFMPEEEGEWTYRSASNVQELTDHTGNFFVTPASKGNHGPVRVANIFHFAYTDGTPFKQVGTTSYTWTHRPAKVEEQTLATLAKSPFNKLRMCVFPQTHGTRSMPPERFPFAGKGTRPDYTRFNPEFFQHLEMRVGQLRDLGIEADLILFHPYDDDHIWGLDNMAPDVEEHYLKYIVARLAAYRNVWWSMANEFDFLENRTTEDWDRYFQIVMRSDPYSHLRSIHNGKIIYDHNKPWVTHASIQNGFAVTSPGIAQLYRDVYNKPIVYDEVEYEGNHDARWAQLSAQELVHRFWAGTVVGTYVGHSEFIVEQGDKNQFVWLGQGGTLKGESPARLAFLREIMETGPAEGFEPIDKWWNPDIGGRHGEYYLIYFGKDSVSNWKFKLPAKGLEEGMEFKLELIDTWDMTVTTLAESVEVEREDRYFFIDKRRRSYPLPRKQGLALRITRIH